MAATRSVSESFQLTCYAILHMILFNFIDVEIIKKDNVFMLDDVVRHNIQNGEEKLVTQPQIKHHSSPHQKRRETQAARPVTTSNKKTKGRPWYETEWGIRFAQFLHSKLQETIDQSTEIEKELKRECVLFSFQINQCSIVLRFPRDFPDSGIEFSCVPPGATDSIKATIQNSYDQTAEQSVKFLVRTIQQLAPIVIK